MAINIEQERKFILIHLIIALIITFLGIYFLYKNQRIVGFILALWGIFLINYNTIISQKTEYNNLTNKYNDKIDKLIIKVKRG